MELTAETFKQLCDSLNYQQQMMTCLAHNNRIGRIANAPFHCQGTFVNNIFEIERLQCTALIKSGRIVQADEAVNIKVPILYGDFYYLCIGFSEEFLPYNKEMVPFVRPKYTYEILPLDEVKQKDRFPLMRFSCRDGRFRIDTQYIAPCLITKEDERIGAQIEKFAEQLESLGAHANFEEGDGKRSILHYAFRLKDYDNKETTSDTMALLQEIAHAVDFFIMKPNTESQPSLAAYEEYDMEKWFTWFAEYLNGASSVLDGVVLEDHSIDLEKMKAEIKAELHEQIFPDLYEKLQTELKEKVLPEMETTIKESITKYINEEMRPQLYDELLAKLDPQLYDRLYQALYDALYNALYVPVEDNEEEFMPQI